LKRSHLVPILSAALALTLAVLASQTRLARLSNMEVPAEPFAHVYVQSKIGSDEKCLVTDRQGATLRRSEPNLAGSRWRCSWTEGAVGERTLVTLTGKEPSYVFVPASRVLDPAFPWIYEAVRQGRVDAAGKLLLPRLRWVHLFHDRRYQGFHLQLRLPDKRFADNRHLGRVELMSAQGDHLYCWNRKLRPTCTLWSENFIAEAVFPEPRVDAGLALLDGLLPPELSRAYYLSAFPLTPVGGLYPDTEEESPPSPPDDVGHLHPLPLPFALEGALGEPMEPYIDSRYRRWARLAPDGTEGPDAEGGPEGEDGSTTVDDSHGVSPRVLRQLLAEAATAQEIAAQEIAAQTATGGNEPGASAEAVDGRRGVELPSVDEIVGFLHEGLLAHRRLVELPPGELEHRIETSPSLALLAALEAETAPEPEAETGSESGGG
jgi:hypothetical protein